MDTSCETDIEDIGQEIRIHREIEEEIEKQLKNIPDAAETPIPGTRIATASTNASIFTNNFLLRTICLSPPANLDVVQICDDHIFSG